MSEKSEFFARGPRKECCPRERVRVQSVQFWKPVKNCPAVQWERFLDLDEALEKETTVATEIVDCCGVRMLSTAGRIQVT